MKRFALLALVLLVEAAPAAGPLPQSTLSLIAGGRAQRLGRLPQSTLRAPQSLLALAPACNCLETNVCNCPEGQCPCTLGWARPSAADFAAGWRLDPVKGQYLLLYPPNPALLSEPVGRFELAPAFQGGRGRFFLGGSRGCAGGSCR